MPPKTTKPTPTTANDILRDEIRRQGKSITAFGHELGFTSNHLQYNLNPSNPLPVGVALLGRLYLHFGNAPFVQAIRDALRAELEAQKE